MYPRLKYNSALDSLLVTSEEQETSLGEEFKDSPADWGIILHPSMDQFYLPAASPEICKRFPQARQVIKPVVKRGPGRPPKVVKEEANGPDLSV